MEARVDFMPRDRPPMMIGGGAGLGGVASQLLRGLVGVGGVVLGEVADGAAADEAAQDGDVNTPQCCCSVRA